MKSILVPTDFSPCASNATDAAMQLAKRFGARVHLYTRLDLPYNWHTLTEDQRNENNEALQKIQNAEALFSRVKSEYPGIDMEYHSSAGNLIENIHDFVAKFNIDFVVMGSHGVSGKNEFFIGSNTQKAVRMIHCPVLVVKNKIENINFQKVVFASSFNKEEREPFLKFKEFIKHFIPEIHLVAVHTSEFFDAPYVLQNAAMNDFKELAKPFFCETHIFRDFSVDRGVRYFADDIGADLIAISNHYRNPIKRMLVGSNVEALVNHANLPVLTIDYKK